MSKKKKKCFRWKDTLRKKVQRGEESRKKSKIRCPESNGRCMLRKSGSQLGRFVNMGISESIMTWGTTYNTKGAID